MLRSFVTFAARSTNNFIMKNIGTSSMLTNLQVSRNWSTYQTWQNTLVPKIVLPNKITSVNNCYAKILQPISGLLVQNRSLTKFSLKKGKRKTVKAVIKRFKRLHWGMWIRTRCGRHKKLFKKSPALKKRLKQHVFTNATQSWLLDKMVTNFWRRPKYYIDDPYEPYHTREEYFATRKKPIKYGKEF